MTAVRTETEALDDACVWSEQPCDLLNGHHVDELNLHRRTHNSHSHRLQAVAAEGQGTIVSFHYPEGRRSSTHFARLVPLSSQSNSWAPITRLASAGREPPPSRNSIHSLKRSRQSAGSNSPSVSPRSSVNSSARKRSPYWLIA